MTQYLIRKDFTPVITGEANKPFNAELFFDQIILKFNSNTLSKIRSKRKIYYYIRNTDFNNERDISLTIPLQDKIQIEDVFGNRWVIKTSFQTEGVQSRIREQFVHYLDIIASFKTSLFSHIALALFFIGLYHGAQNSSRLAEILGTSTSGIKILEQRFFVAKIKKEPFSGLSIKEFTNKQILEEAPIAKINKAASNLSSLAGIFSKKMNTGEVATENKIAKIDTAKVIAESLEQARKNDLTKSKIATTSPVTVNKTYNNQFNSKQSLAEAGMLNLKTKFSQAYDEALQIDPQIHVTLEYSVTINEQGKLTNLNVDVKGTGSTSAKELLRKKTLRIFTEAVFSRICAGITLKGEQIFIK